MEAMLPCNGGIAKHVKKNGISVLVSYNYTGLFMPFYYRTQVSLGSGLLVLVSLSKYIQELFETLLM